VPITDATLHARRGFALTLITISTAFPRPPSPPALEAGSTTRGRPRTGIDPVTTRHICIAALQRRPSRCLTPTRAAWAFR